MNDYFKPFIVVLDIPVEELNLRELELIAFIGHVNRYEPTETLQGLQKLLKEKFAESSLFVGNEGIKHASRADEPVIGRGGSHIWITRKSWLDKSQVENQMCDRTMMIIQEHK